MSVTGTHMEPRENLTDQGLRNGENRPVEVVEAIGSISRELKMLPLIFADRDMGSSDRH